MLRSAEGVGGRDPASAEGENSKSDPGITGNGSSDWNIVVGLPLLCC